MNRATLAPSQALLLVKGAAITALFHFCPLAHAAITLQAGSGIVAPGNSVTLPITATGSWNENWASLNFTLTLNTAGISFGSHAPQNAFITGSSTFNNGSFVWNSPDSINGSVVTPGDRIINVTFNAAANATPGTYTVSFSNSREVGLANSGPQTPGITDGSIEVVPEPVNVALAIFGTGFAGMAILKSLRRKKLSQAAI